MRWAITHRPQDLPRSKHILAEGKKNLEEDMPLLTDDLIGVYAKPERCEGTIDVFVQLAESMDLSEPSLSTREILQCW